MAKYSKKVIERIVELVKSDTYTIAEICQQVGISPATYHRWQDEHEDFRKLINEAHDERMQFFVLEAKKSLLKKIQGYEATETKVVTIPNKKDSEKSIIKEENHDEEALPARHGSDYLHFNEWRPDKMAKQDKQRR